MLRFVVLFALFLCSPHASAQSGPGVHWRQTAKRDIDAVYTIIRENHPGPVDQQNPAFAKWLVKGREAAIREARDVRSRADYWRALRRYVNGFRDGHLSVWQKQPIALNWPGFLTATNHDGATVVTVSEEPNVVLGAVVLGCDGRATASLLDSYVRPFRANADIPHERQLGDSYLLITAADDDRAMFRRCQITTEDVTRKVSMRWRPFDDSSYDARLAAAQQRVVPQLGFREVDGVSIVSLPSFNWWGDSASTMQAFVHKLAIAAEAVHRSRYVVIDLRGNNGGNSEWGSKVASALWGEAAVKAVEGSFDWTVEWRASRDNARLTRAAADQAAVAGLGEDAAQRAAIADQMEASASQGIALMRTEEPPKTAGLPPSYRSPFVGRVFLLTDSVCASACLDFADVVTRMPGVVHVGLPTSADAVYIDNVSTALPSDLADFSYSLKVYRKRTRTNNEWLSPKVVWPGGIMFDETVAAWVKTL